MLAGGLRNVKRRSLGIRVNTDSFLAPQAMLLLNLEAKVALVHPSGVCFQTTRTAPVFSLSACRPMASSQTLGSVCNSHHFSMLVGAGLPLWRAEFVLDWPVDMKGAIRIACFSAWRQVMAQRSAAAALASESVSCCGPVAAITRPFMVGFNPSLRNGIRRVIGIMLLLGNCDVVCARVGAGRCCGLCLCSLRLLAVGPCWCDIRCVPPW